MIKKSSLISCFLIFFSLISVFFGCALFDAPEKQPNETSKIRFYDIPEGVKEYEKAEVYACGERLPVYSVQTNTSQTWTPNNYQRTESGVVLYELDGLVQMTVKPNVKIDYSSKMRPLSAKITPIADIDNNMLTFTIKSAGEYVLEINGDKNNTINFFVSDYEETADTSGYQNIICFGAGLHTSANSPYIKADNTVTVNSNTLVYLQDGAVVRAKFVANNAKNIAIKGRGVIDGSTFERDAVKSSVTVPIDFNYCTNVALEDFTVLDPAGWCVNFYFIETAKIDDIKIITSRSNGDGISLQSCKNVTVDGCFLRTWDDTLVVKNYPKWSDKSQHGSTENIVFKNCTLWTDLAQSMEIGYETVGQKLEGVRFENITVLHALHLAPISIHNANNAAIKKIVYENITIEDAVNPSNTVGIIDIRNLFSENWSTVHTTTALGSINTVSVTNVKVISAKKFSMTLGGCRDVRAGYESDHYIESITLGDVSIGGVCPELSDLKITSGGYLREFDYFTKGEPERITGAQFIFSQSEEYLSKFGDGCSVIKANAD